MTMMHTSQLKLMKKKIKIVKNKAKESNYLIADHLELKCHLNNIVLYQLMQEQEAIRSVQQVQLINFQPCNRMVNQLC